MTIAATLSRIVGTIVASAAVRAFGARLAFDVLHQLASKTDNQLDDGLVQLAEDVYYGKRRPSEPR